MSHCCQHRYVPERVADGGDFDKVRKITIGFAAVKALAAGRVDAVVAFWNVEGVTLKREGVPTREFRASSK